MCSGLMEYAQGRSRIAVITTAVHQPVDVGRSLPSKALGEPDLGTRGRCMCADHWADGLESPSVPLSLL